ncbi:MAG: transcription-repair coupling factor (superfamily II helicase), partial [Lentimonas sp.]
MILNELKEKFSGLKQISDTANELQLVGSRIQWKGLVGSSKTLCSSALASQVPGHHLFILTDKEEAAYFLNDLESLHP